MGLSWQGGPLSIGSIGHFLVPDPLPQRLLYAEPLARRMRVKFGGAWIADSQEVVVLHEPGRYPVAYFPLSDVGADALEKGDRVTHHRDLGTTSWFTVHSGERRAERAAWRHVDLPAHAAVLNDRVAFAWRAMDAFYEEDERIVGHAADPYHRTDVRQSSRRLVVRDGDRVIAESRRPVVVYESGFAPRWYVPRTDIDENALVDVDGQTFCPYKGLATYYDVGDRARAAWSYREAWPEAHRVADMVSFAPERIDVYLDGSKVEPEPGQTVISHGTDRGLDAYEPADGHPS
jgi:uncharacterized protein (DUF427 family)